MEDTALDGVQKTREGSVNERRAAGRSGVAGLLDWVHSRVRVPAVWKTPQIDVYVQSSMSHERARAVYWGSVV